MQEIVYKKKLFNRSKNGVCLKLNESLEQDRAYIKSVDFEIVCDLSGADYEKSVKALEAMIDGSYDFGNNMLKNYQHNFSLTPSLDL